MSDMSDSQSGASRFRNRQSQNARPSQSIQNNQDAEAEGDILLSLISKSKGHLVPMTKKFFENNINFATPFTDETKNTLKQHMIDFLMYENQLKMQQKAFGHLEVQAVNLSQSVSEDQEIEGMLEAANLEEKYEEVMNQLKELDNFDPTENKQFKDLLNLLAENNSAGENEDFEMLETEFTIPIDPFSKKEVVIPVRNKTCGHIYDKDSFSNMFESRPRNSAIKCPITGCSNKRVTIEDVDVDPRTQILIENAKRNQS